MNKYKIIYKFDHATETLLWNQGIFSVRDLGEEHATIYRAESDKHAFMKFQNHSILFYGRVDSRKILDITED